VEIPVCYINQFWYALEILLSGYYERKIMFPFSGIVGQDNAKLALAIAAVDPGMGGVLLSGP
jgi:hypothetical protein